MNLPSVTNSKHQVRRQRVGLSSSSVREAELSRAVSWKSSSNYQFGHMILKKKTPYKCLEARDIWEKNSFFSARKNRRQKKRKSASFSLEDGEKKSAEDTASLRKSWVPNTGDMKSY